ncbi:hypothetical protein LSAT2_007266 [Lamellibrachia satsuma]|nr:hypothetical protein LSAT2_007266 [Lamellibrachia satsuma]
MVRITAQWRHLLDSVYVTCNAVTRPCCAWWRWSHYETAHVRKKALTLPDRSRCQLQVSNRFSYGRPSGRRSRSAAVPYDGATESPVPKSSSPSSVCRAVNSIVTSVTVSCVDSHGTDKDTQSHLTLLNYPT